jgi:peptidoglycan/xylan/chitin deacetylase (PgdA/CDA1 family)
VKAVPKSTPAGLMFHHFHGVGSNITHAPGQGTISAETFDRILTMFKGRLIGAEEWLHRFKSDTLEPHHVCLTFDDALLCQEDIAAPVMEAHGVTGFWFVYTSIFEGVLEKLEIYRYFRNTLFPDIDAFYYAFFSKLATDDPDLFACEKKRFQPESYLPNSPFYTDNDRFFRYLRDRVLGQEGYDRLMRLMMDKAGFRPEEQASSLWLTPEALRSLANGGHVIGLHSHTHPTTLGDLTADQQRREYEANSAAIEQLIGYRPQTVSHPCNSYGEQTLEILSDLGVVMGFRADMAKITGRGPLELPRQDHANLLSELETPTVRSAGGARE